MLKSGTIVVMDDALVVVHNTDLLIENEAIFIKSPQIPQKSLIFRKSVVLDSRTDQSPTIRTIYRIGDVRDILSFFI